MKRFKEFLNEVNQNLLYKDFKKGVFSPKQMEMPFEFSDSMFLSKENEAKHLLASLGNMKIGYEFECYLDADEHETDSDLIHEEHLYDENFFEVLTKYFDQRFNRRQYNNLLSDFKWWLIELHKDEEDFDEDDADENSEEFDDFFRFISKGSFEKVIRKYEFSIDDDYMLEDNNIYRHVEIDGRIDLETEFRRLASYLKGTFKCMVFHNSSKKFLHKKSDEFWYVEPDSSLNDENPDEDSMFGVEIVSKTYPAHLFKEIFYKLKKALNKGYRNPTTNSATGLHFSVSFDDAEKNSRINLLKLIILGQDTFFLKRVGRQFNEYCESQLKNVLIQIETITDALELPLTKEYLKDNTSILDDIEEAVSKDDKFMAINFKKYKNKKGFLEFRLTGNDYFGEKEKQNLSTIEWFLYVLIASTSKTLWEDHYLSWIENYSRSILKNP